VSSSSSRALTAPTAPGTGRGQHAGDRTYRAAMARLAGHQKTAKGAPAYSRFVNRRLGRHLAALAYSAGLTPNQVTAISSVFTFGAIVAVATVPPSVPMALAVVLALVLGYALDSADGQLARLRGGGSPSGEWLDHVLDSLKTVSVHTAVLLSAYRFADLSTDRWLLVPLAYLVVANVWFFTVILTDQLRRSHHAAAGTAVVAPGTPAPVLRSVLSLPTDYGLLCLLFVLLPWGRVFLSVYGLVMLGNVLYLLAALPTWFRELSAFRPAAGSRAAS
jgi:phosphatidylglycerophosphate synthase